MLVFLKYKIGIFCILDSYGISGLRSDEKVASLLVVMLKWMAESPEISLPRLQEIQDKENGKILV